MHDQKLSYNEHNHIYVYIYVDRKIGWYQIMCLYKQKRSTYETKTHTCIFVIDGSTMLNLCQCGQDHDWIKLSTLHIEPKILNKEGCS